MDDRQPRIEQADEEPRHPRLGLAALAQEDEVVARQDRVLDRRDDRILVADDAGEDLSACREPGQEIGAQLVLDGARPPARGFQGAQRLRLWSGAGGLVHGVIPRCETGLGARA